MDFTDALKAGGASATIITIAGIVIKILHSMCGNRIRSECCGHTATMGVRVETMSSNEKKPEPEPEHTTVELKAENRTPRPSLESVASRATVRNSPVLKPIPEPVHPDGLPADSQI